MPSDITQAIEQDLIAESLLGDISAVQRYDEGQNTGEDTGTEYRYADGQNVDTGQEQEQPADTEQQLDDADLTAEPQDELPEVTPEQLETYQQQQEEWQALPTEQQAQVADQMLHSAYTEAYNSVSPKDAADFTNDFGRSHWGIDNLSQVVDPQEFTAFEEAWADNAENLVAHHQHREQFLEALGRGQSQEALRIAQSMVDPVMSERYLPHFMAVTNGIFGDTVKQWTPVQFAAKCLCDFARANGWASQPQSNSRTQPRSGSFFETNTDLFDDEAMEEIMRRGLL
jgi:hypothetical protein